MASVETAQVRRMAPADVARVAAIEAKSFTSPWQAGTFRALLARPGAELWVLDDPEEGVIGYAVLWCILDEGELANIAVAEPHRGRGLGGRLLSAIMDIGRTRGVISLYLEVRVSNHRAAELYRRFGFESIGVRRNYYDSPREDAVLMRARLSE